MSTQGEPVTRASTPRQDPSTRLRRWAARRTRQLFRVVLALSFFTVFVTTVVLIGRQLCLFNRPDVGDPFNVASEFAAPVPDDRDAFNLFRQAQAKLRLWWPDIPRSVLHAGPEACWKTMDPKLRAWVEANREALELFRRGAERPGGWAHTSGDETAFHYDRLDLSSFAWLALLEGSRLEEQGDMPGAWAWYRAVLGMRAHVMRAGSAFERWHASINCTGLPARVALWAADRRTQVLDLRRALDDVIAHAPRPEWEASSLKVDYLLAMRELNLAYGYVVQGRDEDRSYHIGGEELPPNLAQSVYALRRFLIREPERSRRVLRLAFANWLAHVQVPEERHRKPAVRGIFLSGGATTSLCFYATGPAAPASARTIAPKRVAEWLLTAPDAKLLLSQWPGPSTGRQERWEHHRLVIMLAEELDLREHGRPPSSKQALVGTYLKSLPDDGTADLDGGMIPTVEVSPRSATGTPFPSNE